MAGVVQYVQRVVDDPRVEVKRLGRFSAKPSANVFRFMPAWLSAKDLDRIHGTNERIAVRDYERAIRLYRQLILNAAGTGRAEPPDSASSSAGGASSS